MINRFKLIWSGTNRLKVEWINFLGTVVYYTNGINVHHHIFYNRRAKFCYTMAGPVVCQHFGINATNLKISDDRIHRCIICNEKSPISSYLKR